MSSHNITVILNAYKRPHVLNEQITAIRNQTIPPKQIIIWRNHAEGYDIPTDIRADKSIIIMDSSQNLGVWARFAAGLLANTEFVCFFDDDTIPGRKWFENCLNTMDKVNGLLGTIGLIFNPNPERYYTFRRVGWDCPNSEIVEVDLVGHSWFLRRKWLPELFKIVPDYDKLFLVGEDMGLSWALQQIGIKTYVPPHPESDIEMFGSMPSLAYKYGCESVGISMNNPNFDEMFWFYKNKGFKFINT
jgi:GT2 family glycosyltransferase